MAKIQETIAAQLSRYSIAGYDNIKQHVILSVALAFCIMAHTYLLVFFAMGKIEPLIIANIGSLAIYYFTAAFLIKRRRYLIIRTIIVCEVSLYATFTGYMFGIGNYITAASPHRRRATILLWAHKAPGCISKPSATDWRSSVKSGLMKRASPLTVRAGTKSCALPPNRRPMPSW